MKTEEIIFLVILFVILPIYLIYQDQNEEKDNKGKKKTGVTERIGEATKTYANGVAKEVSNLVTSLTESDETRDRKNLIWRVQTYITQAMTGSYYSDKSRLYDYDYKVKEAFGVDEEEWKRIVDKSLAIGELYKTCHFNGELKKNDPKWNLMYYNGNEYDDGQSLRDALNYLGIPKDDWIKWGFATISMYESVEEIDVFLCKIK